MLFPFYISGTSKTYGPYTSVFPVYGDIYERFWRDEYHYVLFPVYGKTVKKGTATSNYLYPFFSTTEGDRESGFQFWPLYGQSAKEGVYSKRFVAWPFYLQEKSGLDTDNPASKVYLLPLYATTDSPMSTSRYYLWPFFGYKSDREGKQEERDYFWPFIRTIRGENRTLDSYLPVYSRDVSKETRKRWIFWPVIHERGDRLCHFPPATGEGALFPLFGQSGKLAERWRGTAQDRPVAFFCLQSRHARGQNPRTAGTGGVLPEQGGD